MRRVPRRSGARVRGLMICTLLGAAGVTIAAPRVYVENVTASAIIALDGGTGRVMGRIAIPGRSHRLAYEGSGKLSAIG